MRHKLGWVLVALGCILLAASLTLYLHNRQEQRSAESASREAIGKVLEVIRERQEVPEETAQTAVPTEAEERTMTVADIDGYGYIGFVSIPALGLELPVMADWSYPRLRIAPCRYSGSIFTDDLVLMAHNYRKHFGPIRRLKSGDGVIFTDMDGESVRYRVVAVEILGAGAVEEVTSGDYDLTLFTCTYGGENRVTVRCDRE